MSITLSKNANRSQLTLLALDYGDTIAVHRTRLDGTLVPEPVDTLPVLHRRLSPESTITPHEWSRVVTLRANRYAPDRPAWTVLADDIRLPGRSLLDGEGVEGGTVRRVSFTVVHPDLTEADLRAAAVRAR